ncbi:MAG: BON domain-containing protein [Undibacterium sp.]|uniref:BON domain-containing protein n=1 Tax=Undibacterium sp. TaxID=1914977 RepID=UPI002723E08E|nr:BON domain-containing protein [Undibacterium sp.]MDO8653953.1 BON domain-containing protein [Undibacterium sp.]
MISDSEIKKNVEAELQWDPDIKMTDIGVSVKDGVVALTGFVSTLPQKFQAEIDVKRIVGVSGVANDIEVRLPNVDKRPDPEIARDAVTALQFQLPVAYGNVKVVVRDGWIILEGEMEWQHQKEKAENSIRHLNGVIGVTNNVTVKPIASPVEIKRKIEEAFKRNAEIDANNIVVETYGGEVILKGSVHTWFERKEAERAAWSAPGVTKVQDRISIQP